MEELGRISLRYSLVDPSADSREDLARDLRNMPLQPGPATLNFLQSRITLKSPDPPDDIPPPQTYVHAVLVYSNGKKPEYCAVESPMNALAEHVAEAVAASLGISCATETVMVGYLNFDHSSITKLFAPDEHITCANFLGQTLTAWHVRRSATGYAVATPWNSSTHHKIGAPFIAPLAQTWQEMHADMRAAMSGYCDGDPSTLMLESSATISDPAPHYAAQIDREINVFLKDDRLEECGFNPRRPKLHDAPSPMRSAILRSWSYAAARAYRISVIQRQDVQNLLDTMLYHSTYLYGVQLSECGALCIIRVFSLTGRLTHYAPSDGSEAPNARRWVLARKIVEANRYTPWPSLLPFLELPEDSPTHPQPPGVSLSLKRHQLQNLHFMVRREKASTFHSDRYTILPGLPPGRVLYYDAVTQSTTTGTGNVRATGGFLSDPMGSGKTSTVVALVAANPRRPGTPRATIVVCPSSVLGQWAREIRATAPDLAVFTYHGKNRAGTPAMHLVENFDIVLTTYTTYLLSLPALGSITWHRAVFDEAHGMGAQFAARSPDADRRWCLTATPQKNADRQLTALRSPRISNVWSPAHVMFALMPMMIYRTATEHTSALPALTETEVPVSFNGDDRLLYDHAFQAARAWYERINALSVVEVQGLLRPLLAVCAGGVRMSMASVEPGYVPVPRARHADPRLVCPDGECPICYNVYEDPAVTPCGHWFCDVCISTALQRTGMACPMCRRALSPGLLRLGVRAPPESGTSAPEIGTAAADHGDSFPCMSKIDAVIDMLELLRSSDATGKFLVFSHSNAALKALRPLLAARGFGVRTIHGGMAVPQRSSAVAAFQSDPRTTVFLLGARAACTGINLTAANHVVIMDPGFDAVEETQCIGRAHRFGQTREVSVWRMYLRGTVEETILATRMKCLDLARSLFM